MLYFQVYGCSTHFQEEHLFYELVLKSSLARVSARISQASAVSCGFIFITTELGGNKKADTSWEIPARAHFGFLRRCSIQS